MPGHGGSCQHGRKDGGSGNQFQFGHPFLLFDWVTQRTKCGRERRFRPWFLKDFSGSGDGLFWAFPRSQTAVMDRGGNLHRLAGGGGIVNFKSAVYLSGAEIVRGANTGVTRRLIGVDDIAGRGHDDSDLAGHQ